MRRVVDDRQTALRRVDMPNDFEVGRRVYDRGKLREDPTGEEGLDSFKIMGLLEDDFSRKGMERGIQSFFPLKSLTKTKHFLCTCLYSLL